MDTTGKFPDVFVRELSGIGSFGMDLGALREAERIELGERIDRLRRSKRMTLTALSIKAGYDEATIRKVVAGRQVRDKTLQDVCSVLGISAINSRTDVAEFSDERHGAYCNKTTAAYCGTYIANRWSYNKDRNIVQSVFTIEWNSTRACLTFSELQDYISASGKRVNFNQDGEVFSSENTGLLHLLTITGGMVRSMTLTKMQAPETTMRGVVLTQARTTLYRQPALSPMLLNKLTKTPSDPTQLTGEISPGDSAYAGIAAELREIEREVVLSTFASGAMNADGESHLHAGAGAQTVSRPQRN